MRPQNPTLHVSLMQSSTQSDGEIIAKMRSKKIRQWLYAIPMVASAIMIGLLRGHVLNLTSQGEDIGMVVSIALFIAMLVVNSYDWRCPLCKSYIGRSRADACSTCGVRFK